MPRKNVVKDSPERERSPIGIRKIGKDDQWGGYVQCNIGDAEREAFDLWLSESIPYLPALLADTLATGLKLTAVYDGQNECFIATFTGRPDIAGQVEFTCSLSARGGSLEQAINVNLYKHIVVTGEDWTDWLVNGTRARRTFG
jgi:hypothetical protein